MTFYLAVAGAIFIAWFILVALFTPGIDYHLRRRLSIESPDFLHTLQTTCQTSLYEHNRISLYATGARFYPAMIDAIRSAARSVNIESYILHPGKIANQFVDALSERAHAGVIVTVVLDAIGSAMSYGKPVQRLRDAGCRVAWYQGLTWYRLARLNNRTHRELLIVDGRVAFVGGAGVADFWAMPTGIGPAWRDTMVRADGPVVAALQGAFVENWLECCGEILVGDEFFPPLAPAGETTAFVVKSSPADRATVSRVVFQMLLEGGERHLRITTPYFLPDRALRRRLAASASRGVKIHVIVPGARSDQRLVRLASRRLYGELLAAGVRIFEYQPAMIHAKTLIVDEAWAVVGTTNIDNRSFEHNDEVNLAMRDPAIARQLIEQFEADLADCREVTLDAWRRRPVWEKAAKPFAWILERQQ